MEKYNLDLETLLEDMVFASAKDLIEYVASCAAGCEHVVFSPEELVRRTGAIDIDLIDDAEEFQNLYDLELKDENGTEKHYAIQAVCYGGTLSPAPNLSHSYVIRVVGKGEDLRSTDLISGDYAVRSIEDMKAWMDEWMGLYEGETAWPTNLISLLCQRNGWEDLSGDGMNIVRDGKKTLVIMDKPYLGAYTYISVHKSEDED